MITRFLIVALVVFFVLVCGTDALAQGNDEQAKSTKPVNAIVLNPVRKTDYFNYCVDTLLKSIENLRLIESIGSREESITDANIKSRWYFENLNNLIAGLIQVASLDPQKELVYHDRARRLCNLEAKLLQKYGLEQDEKFAASRAVLGYFKMILNPGKHVGIESIGAGASNAAKNVNSASLDCDLTGLAKFLNNRQKALVKPAPSKITITSTRTAYPVLIRTYF